MDKSSNHKVYEFEKFRLEAVHLMLYRENEEIPLAPKAVETLIALVERRGEILTKDELMSIIWTDSIVEESNLAGYLHVLRKTLGASQNGKPFIETYRRRGYRFNADVAVSESANGLSAQRHAAPDEIKNRFSDNAAGTRNPNQRGLRVQRQGNVFALAEWSDISPESKNEAARTATITPGRSPRQSPATRNAVLVIAALAVGTAILFGVYRLAGDSQPPQRVASVPFGEMNISRAHDLGQNHACRNLARWQVCRARDR